MSLIALSIMLRLDVPWDKHSVSAAATHSPVERLWFVKTFDRMPMRYKDQNLGTEAVYAPATLYVTLTVGNKNQDLGERGSRYNQHSLCNGC